MIALIVITTANNIMKDQRENNHGNVVSKGCQMHSQDKYVDSQELIIEVINNKHSKDIFRIRTNMEIVILSTHVIRTQLANQH